MVFGRMSFFSVFVYLVLPVSILCTLLKLVLLPILGSKSPNSRLSKSRVQLLVIKAKRLYLLLLCTQGCIVRRFDL